MGEAARKQNKSPGTVLAEALRRAAADRTQVAAELQAEEQAMDDAARSSGAHGSASSRNCDVATQSLRLNNM